MLASLYRPDPTIIEKPKDLAVFERHGGGAVGTRPAFLPGKQRVILRQRLGGKISRSATGRRE